MAGTTFMVKQESPVYKESYYPVKLGQGIYTSELPSNIPDGFSSQAYNLVATGDSLENRIGIRQSSVDWNLSLPLGSPIFLIPSDYTCLFQMGSFNNSNEPVLTWGIRTTTGWQRAFIRSQGGGANDGFMLIDMGALPQAGACQYLDRMYLSMDDANRVYRITAFNWATDAITYTSIPSAATVPTPYGLFSFKDRLWGFSGDRLYFTEIAVLGGYPETWSATNYIPFRADKGFSVIKSVVPLANKLCVFTETGAYTVLVEGEPSSWLKRTLDSESSSTWRQCAFESKGIVYYVNTQGVWATNGQSVAKLSPTIEDLFFLSKGQRLHSIHSYEDGILLSISKINSDYTYDAPNCKILYTKTDPIGWTEWNIEAGDGTTNAFGGNRIVQIQSVSPKYPSFLNPEPTNYILATVSDSTAAVHEGSRVQLLIFDGGENQLRDRAGTLITQPMNCVLKTKYMDAGNPYGIKSNKKAFLEMYTSDAMHKFTTAWDIDSTVGLTSEIRRKSTQDFTIGMASNLLQLPADFMFRRCALTLSTALQTNTSQVKIKDLALVIAEAMDVKELVQ